MYLKHLLPLVLPFFFFCSGSPVTTSGNPDRTVSFHFIATPDDSWSYFVTGDTIEGVLTYDSTDFVTGDDSVTIRQNYPLANLVIRYKQASTGKVVAGSVDASSNNTADLTAYIRPVSWDATTMRYVNITTEPNDLFVESGMDFGTVLFRFADRYRPGITDLMDLRPSYLTMNIHINKTEYGPNFVLDTLYRIDKN